MKFYKYISSKYNSTFYYRVKRGRPEWTLASDLNNPDGRTSSVFDFTTNPISSNSPDFLPEELILLSDDDPFVIRCLLEEL
jgi:hypothetical protein